ncbi:MAG TPA: hypothetical protein V6D18_10255 [Thermosynechococcaceae cyanobacterium]
MSSSLSTVGTIVPTSQLHATLQVALSTCCDRFHWDYGEMWLPCQEEQVLELHPAFHITPHKSSADAIALEQFWDCTKGLGFPLGVGLPGRVWASQEFEWLPDAASPSEREFLRHYIAKALDVKTGIGLPILVDRQVVAVFVYFMLSIRAADAALIESMTAFTALIGHQLSASNP